MENQTRLTFSQLVQEYSPACLVAATEISLFFATLVFISNPVLNTAVFVGENILAGLIWGVWRYRNQKVETAQP